MPHEVHVRQYLPRPGAGRPVQHGDYPDRSEDPPAGHDDRGHPHPFLSDRFLAIQNAQYIFRTMHDLGSEIVFKAAASCRTAAPPTF